jgi:hypothetical protein
MTVNIEEIHGFEKGLEMRKRILYTIGFILAVTLACSTMSFPAPDPTVAPTFTPIPAPTAVPEPALLSESLTLTSTPFSETKDGPVYTITAQIPQLQGSDDSRVAAFNTYLNDVVQNNIGQFRNDILANQPVTPFMAGSSYDLKFTQIGQRGEVWSIKLEVMYYYDGAAHPGHYSITVNYDLGQGRELALDDLFQPNSNYLQVIADECKAQLSTRNIGFEDAIFNSGADPLPENYQRWNLSPDGLLVTFDEYQVAPYAAGPQTVLVPFDRLMPLASPQSALGVFSQ